MGARHFWGVTQVLGKPMEQKWIKVYKPWRHPICPRMLLNCRLLQTGTGTVTVYVSCLCSLLQAADAGLNRSAVTQTGSFEGETGIHQETETVKKTLEIFALKLSPYVKPNSNEESLAVTKIVSNIRLFQLCPGRINRVFFFASRKRKDTLEAWETGWKNSTWKLV